MTINLKLERAMGHLTVNRSPEGPRAPDFIGTVGLAHYNEDDEPFIRLAGAAWLKNADGVEHHLAVQLIGLEGKLHPYDKRHPLDPDYIGTLGRDGSLFVAAWKRFAHGALAAISLEFDDRGCSPFDTVSARSKVQEV